MSYIIPCDKLTLTDMKQYRDACLAAGISRAVTLKIRGTPNELTSRQPLNILDFGTALEQWNTAALAVVGTQYTCFQAVVAPVLANNKICAFYGASVETVPSPVSRLTFRSGGAAGNIIAEFDLEQLINADTMEGYFNEPVVIDPLQIFAAQVTCRIATGLLARVQLMAYLIEPIGQFIA